MATNPPATKEGSPPKKPIDWSQHMVVASLKFYSSIDTPVTTYETLDAGRLAVFDVLNWHEAHDEYAWPNFANLGFDFAQASSFRRHLVSDVFAALEKAGVVGVGGEAGGEGATQGAANREGSVGANVGMRISERKRQCRREDEADAKA